MDSNRNSIDDNHPKKNRERNTRSKQDLIASYDKSLNEKIPDEKLNNSEAKESRKNTKKLRHNAKHELEKFDWINKRIKKRDDQISEILERARKVTGEESLQGLSKIIDEIMITYNQLEKSYGLQFDVEKSYIAKYIPKKWSPGTPHYKMGTYIAGASLTSRGVRESKQQLDELIHKCQNYLSKCLGETLSVDQVQKKQESKKFSTFSRVKSHLVSKSMPGTPDESPDMDNDRKVRRVKSMKEEAAKSKALLWSELLKSQTEEKVDRPKPQQSFEEMPEVEPDSKHGMNKQ